MWNAQKIGGLAAFVQIGLVALALLADLVLLPAAGLSPITGQSPSEATVLASHNNPTLILIDLGFLVLSQTLILIWIGLYERFKSKAPNRSRLALIAIVMSSALFFMTAVLSAGNRSVISTLTDQSSAAQVDITLRAITENLAGGGAFMLGWATLLTGWASLSKGGLPKLLSWFLLISGISLMSPVLVGVIADPGPTILLSIGIVAEATVPIWNIWLGIELWRGDIV